MRAPGLGPNRWTRRAVLSSLVFFPAATGAQKRRVFPSERVRFPDGATEFLVERLTDPAHASFLPASGGRAVARRGAFLLFWSDRTGSAQAFRMDERTGQMEQLTEAAALDGSSIALAPDDRSFCYFDGPVLRRAAFSRLGEKAPYRVPNGWDRGRGFSLSREGSWAALIETRDGGSRLRVVRQRGGSATTVLERSGIMSDPILHPRRDLILYRYSDALWLTGFRGQPHLRLPLAAGRIGPALWSPDGRTVLYLHHPEEPGKLAAIREYNPEGNSDRLISTTSQFAHFGVNSDASVFVGASASKASPHLLLLLRSTGREFTLCEHRASDPVQVAPVFSPDSRRVYFQSDWQGKPAIYRMTVERLVEPTQE